MIYISRKERVVITAIEIIDELGFQALSTKEICKRQGISEGTLYKHFGSKSEIVMATLDYYAKYDEDLKQSIELKGLSSKEGIRYLIVRLAEYYENYPALTAIMNSYELLRHEEKIKHRIEGIFLSREAFIKEIIDRGIKSGELAADTDGDSLADILFGSFRAVTLKWRIHNYNFPLKDKIIKVTELILQSF